MILPNFRNTKSIEHQKPQNTQKYKTFKKQTDGALDTTHPGWEEVAAIQVCGLQHPMRARIKHHNTSEKRISNETYHPSSLQRQMCVWVYALQKRQKSTVFTKVHVVSARHTRLHIVSHEERWRIVVQRGNHWSSSCGPAKCDMSHLMRANGLQVHQFCCSFVKPDSIT